MEFNQIHSLLSYSRTSSSTKRGSRKG